VFKRDVPSFSTRLKTYKYGMYLAKLWLKTTGNSPRCLISKDFLIFVFTVFRDLFFPRLSLDYKSLPYSIVKKGSKK